MTPGLLHLVSRDAPTRAILAAGAGGFERAYVTLTQGDFIIGEDAAEQVATLKDGIKNAQMLYKSGMANYLEVITAQANSLQAELNLVSIKRQRLSSMVDLYRALGGGWK